MENEADVHMRHKEEHKKLNAQIQALKNSVPKGDKKKKKEIVGEIALLTAHLEQQQTKELAQLPNAASITNGTHNVEDECEVAALNINEEDEQFTTQSQQPPQQRVSKAQKRRDKKEAEERARQKRIEDGASDSANHSRNVEAAIFDKIIKEKGLKIVEIKPDGNCMYNAVLIRLQGVTTKDELKIVREATCDYMLEHIDDFLPFTSNNTNGDLLSIDEYEKYCSDIKETNSWGGHLELRAISQIYKVPIEVYQAHANALLIGEEFLSDPVRLSYHRHQYGLGEHYNALLIDT